MTDQTPQSGREPGRGTSYNVYRVSESPDGASGGAPRHGSQPAAPRDGTPPPAPLAPQSRHTRSRAARRRRLLLRRLIVFGVLVVLIAAIAGTAWAVLGGNGGGGDGSGSDAEPAVGQTSPAASGGVAEASPSPTPSPTPSAPAVIEIGWIGDTTPGSKYGLPPDNGRALFATTKTALRRPDLMIANLEGTYSTSGPSKCDGQDSSACYAFQAPPSYVTALPWAGIDMVSVANNHSYDYLQRGFDQTIAALEGAEVEYAGRPQEVTVTEVDGVRVAVVAFSPYSWNPSVNDIPGAEKLVVKAAKKADVVVVLMHAGAEGADLIHTPSGPESAYGEARGDSRAFAHACVDAGADLVLGSGPHVIRGIERYNDRLIAYSLGNFAGWGNFGTGGNLSLSGLLTVKLDAKGRIHSGRWLSLLISGQGVPSVDGGDTSAHLVRDLSAADFPKTYELDSSGRFETALGRAAD